MNKFLENRKRLPNEFIFKILWQSLETNRQGAIGNKCPNRVATIQTLTRPLLHHLQPNLAKGLWCSKGSTPLYDKRFTLGYMTSKHK